MVDTFCRDMRIVLAVSKTYLLTNGPRNRAWKVGDSGGTILEDNGSEILGDKHPGQRATHSPAREGFSIDSKKICILHSWDDQSWTGQIKNCQDVMGILCYTCYTVRIRGDDTWRRSGEGVREDPGSDW